MSEPKEFNWKSHIHQLASNRLFFGTRWLVTIMIRTIETHEKFSFNELKAYLSDTFPCLQVSDSTIRRYLNFLCERGYVTRNYNSKILYQINSVESLIQVLHSNHTEINKAIHYATENLYPEYTCSYGVFSLGDYSDDLLILDQEVLNYFFQISLCDRTSIDKLEALIQDISCDGHIASSHPFYNMGMMFTLMIREYLSG